MNLTTGKRTAGAEKKSRVQWDEDFETIEKVRQGDPDAFRTLVEKYERLVFCRCLQILKSPEDAEDCVQTAFLKAYLALSDFQSGNSFKAWLHRIATNVALDAGRKRKRTPSAPGNAEPLDFRQPGEGLCPREVTFRREVGEKLLAALDCLEDRFRRPLVQFYGEGLDYVRIAEKEGIPLGTLKNNMYRGRKRLKELLEQATGPECVMALG
jgi:RNA polymerase sigma-70 factor, ECF subfamily